MFKFRNIDVIVYVIVIIFGIGLWVDINGLWVEFLVMIIEGFLEGWKLFLYLFIII